MKISDFYETEDALADALEMCKEVYSGGYSRVYVISENLVIKETDDEEYLKFVNVVQNSTYHKSFPVIYDVQIINNVHYLLMEKLEKFYSDHEDSAEIAGYAEKCSDLWIGYDEELDKALTTLDNVWYGLDKNLDQPCWDLRTSNIMKRRNGALVITDPWSEYDW